MNFTLLQTAAPAGGGYMQIVMLVLIIVVFYFFMIRPQTKKAKEAKKFQEGVKKGDKVVTIGGIIGKIAEVQDTSYTIEVEGGTRIRILKTAISQENSAALNAADAPKA
jgi:preprotein translocase subunit YajC